ncbi:helix-turn-helix domain-containing protein [Bordetella genomosp. 12]|uniref:Transcriptional regulator n=1 Tax=Bordetella genomosp. 12 TaxID=463035 RepID=A0A261VD01_9BORD|nr:helix-turn-helix domain-containing protein [Bordetella genomosp. 12]OZI72004.1 transcriptional regulator [Bordetella genomosp. 12]
MKTFSDRLRQARALRGYTQQDLARACGLSQSAIGSYETSQRLSSRSVRRLAMALNVSLDWLEMGRGPMDPGTSLAEPAPETVDNVAAWPFRTVTPAHIASLSKRDLRLLENTVRSFIEACQAEPGHPSRPAKPKKPR